ncbi:MAG: hypothetical protein Q8P16_00310, partial [bacterium]|nr:hypothetical protein [bacterium]
MYPQIERKVEQAEKKANANMNKNVIIGLLVVVAAAAIGTLFYVNPSAIQNSLTPTSTTSGNTPNNVVQASAPLVVTDISTVVSNSTAVVSGRVTPNGAQTSYWYEYGKTTTFGSRTASQLIGSGFTAIPAPSYITGLSANTLYYYRLVAQNSLGMVAGTMYSFTTNSNPPPQANA